MASTLRTDQGHAPTDSRKERPHGDGARAHMHSHLVEADPRPSHPEALDGERAGGAYTCPMHPEIVRDAPGSCPICGSGARGCEAGHARSDQPDEHEQRPQSAKSHNGGKTMKLSYARW